MSDPLELLQPHQYIDLAWRLFWSRNLPTQGLPAFHGRRFELGSRLPPILRQKEFSQESVHTPWNILPSLTPRPPHSMSRPLSLCHRLLECWHLQDRDYQPETLRA